MTGKEIGILDMFQWLYTIKFFTLDRWAFGFIAVENLWCHQNIVLVTDLCISIGVNHLETTVMDISAL